MRIRSIKPEFWRSDRSFPVPSLIYSGGIETDWSRIGKPAWNRMYIYAFADRDEALLYIGLTWNPLGRWQAHRRKKDWWAEVASVSVYEIEGRNRAEADAAAHHWEKYAIHNLLPLKNITGPPNLPSKAIA